MTIDWNEAQKTAGNFAQMAEPGFYKVEIADLKVRESKNSKGGTSYWLEFEFVDDEKNNIRFPKVSHSISRNNINWCAWHFKTMLEEFGVPEDKAKQAIENCESKKSEKDIMSAYEATFRRAVEKNPELEIQVFEDDNINPKSGRPYMRADFKSSKLAFGRDKKKAETVSPSSIMDDGETVDLSDVPF